MIATFSATRTAALETRTTAETLAATGPGAGPALAAWARTCTALTRRKRTALATLARRKTSALGTTSTLILARCTLSALARTPEAFASFGGTPRGTAIATRSAALAFPGITLR